ncbi:MAG: hypothetical protein ACXWJB_01335 [Limisphaerales bacterium]
MRPMTLMSKTILALVGAIAVAQSALAFTPTGPFESWQTPDLDYAARPIQGGAELGGPKNLGEEWRLNTPIITYGFDFTFLDYFGSNGVKAVDAAFTVFNRLPAVSRTSADLSEYITEGNQRINQSAQALNLLDLKSETMFLIIEHMGLMSETHTFDLRQRIAQTGGTCQFDYVVINRNFDPITWEPTHYVNGLLYTYQIEDLCPVRSVGDAVEIPVDPTGIVPTSVASAISGQQFGGFYLGLTRDDVGGLRYLYRHNNYNNEILPTDAIATTAVSPWTPVNPFTLTNLVSTNTLALRGGVEKITFVKTRYDSLFGSTFQPITYTYNLPIVTNFHVVNQTVRRTIVRPDILFTAADISAPPVYTATTRSISFITNGNTSVISTAGPGTIAPQMIVTFNKVGPLLFNSHPFFLDEQTAQAGFIWGSFDGTTNAPIIFPQGTSIREIENQVLNPALVDTNVSGAYNPVF